MKIYYTQAQISGKDYIRTVLAREYGVSAPEIVFSENGKPALRDSALFFNLSHSGKTTALAVGNEEMGLDLEERKNRNRTALLRRMTPCERSEDFFRVWTAKEAYIKLLGGSLARFYRRLEYRRSGLFCDGAPVPAHFFFCELEGCALTLCTESPVSVELVRFDPIQSPHYNTPQGNSQGF